MLLRLIRLIVWVLLLSWIVALGRRLFRARPAATPRTPERRRLHRDPLCGTFLPAEISHRLTEGGQVLHFCSAECRERYVRGVRAGTG